MDQYVTDVDISRFSQFLNLDRDAIRYEVDIITGNDILNLFENTNAYFCVLFKQDPNPRKVVGHWTCMIKHNDEVYEYFDCLGDPVPENIINAFRQLGVQELQYSDKELMNRNGIICGKWVISRVLALPNSLDSYVNFFLENIKGMTPDEVINMLFNLPVEESSEFI